MSQLLILTTIALLAVTSSSSRLEPEYLPPRGYARSSAGASNYAGAGAYSSASASASAWASANYENVNNGDGAYRYSYDTPNGISAHESGTPRVAGAEGAAVAAEGGFSYRAPDGQQIALTYTADERGFRPSGAHLPTPPPIPEAILRSIEFNKRNPSSDNDGAYRSNSNGYRY